MVVFVWNTPDTVKVQVILFSQIMLEIEHSLNLIFWIPCPVWKADAIFSFYTEEVGVGLVSLGGWKCMLMQSILAVMDQKSSNLIYCFMRITVTLIIISAVNFKF